MNFYLRVSNIDRRFENRHFGCRYLRLPLIVIRGRCTFFSSVICITNIRKKLSILYLVNFILFNLKKYPYICGSNFILGQFFFTLRKFREIVKP